VVIKEHNPQPASAALLEGVEGRRVAVTGASGFLGSHLISRLVAAKAEVHAVSRYERAAGEDIRWWKGDIADIGCARQLLATVKPDVIYHLAGLSTALPQIELVLPTFQSLLASTVNVLATACEIGRCRVVLAASLTEPESGESQPTPGSPYAAAKWAASGYGRMFHRLYDLPVVLVRPFMTYGPGQDPRKMIPHVILSLLRNDPPKLSSGKQQFDWIYVDDVIDGFLAAAQRPDVDGRSIDLGSGVTTSIHDVVRRLVAIMGTDVEPLFGALPDRPLEWVRIADVEDAFQRLGWRSSTPLEAGLARTVEWFSTHETA
jgi:UDP-glucose 4-epimerase